MFVFIHVYFIEEKFYIISNYEFNLGYIPQHKLKYGQTFKRTTDDAISEFKRRDFLQRQAQKELQEAVKDFEKLVVKEDYPKPEPTHPGYRARFYFSKTGRKFGWYY